MNLSEDKATELLCKYNQSESLRKHAKTVQAIMKHFAELKGEDANYWGIVGLLHDLDYEQYPDEHCIKVVDILKENGYPDEFIYSVVSHGWNICADKEPLHIMEKVLYTTDELSGIISAYIYMLPSKDVNDVKVSSIKKRFKTPSFAASVNREVILKGCDMLGMTLDEVIAETVEGMKKLR